MQLETIGLLGIVFSVGSSVPQLIKTIRTGRTRDLSFFKYFFVVIGLTLLTIYSIGKHDAIMAVSNASSTIILSALLVFKTRSILRGTDHE